MAFQCAARRQVGLSGILLDYLLLPNDSVNYDKAWNSKEEKPKNFIIFVGRNCKDEAESLYTLLLQKIGTSEPASFKSIIALKMEGVATWT